MRSAVRSLPRLPRLPRLPGLRRLEGEERALLRDVSWDQYEAILGASGDSGAPRFAYLDGDLEIMSPSPLHEMRKKLLARLVDFRRFRNSSSRSPSRRGASTGWPFTPAWA